MRTFQRGFFCGDLSLRYPYHDCTITVPMLLVMMLLLPMLFISVVEIMRICKHFRMRQYARNLCRNQATFSFGFIATYLTTELAKHVVGRLRPHFYTACLPRLNDGTSCDDAQNHNIYVEHFYCTNRNLSARQLRELHVSFPSAHSSLSFYSMCLLAFYLHSAWQGRGSCRVLRHIIQFLMLMLAWYISLSRVADYWHHWSDVLAGAVLGVIYATITAIYVGDMLRLEERNGYTGGGVGGSGGGGIGSALASGISPHDLGYVSAPTCALAVSENNNFHHHHLHHTQLHHQSSPALATASAAAAVAAAKVHFLAHDCDCHCKHTASTTTVLPNSV